MTSVDLYRWTLVLPLTVPIVVNIAARAFPGLSPLAFILLFSLQVAGGAYLLLGGGLLVWAHGRTETEVRRAFNLAPLLMLPLAWIWIAPRFWSGDLGRVLLDPGNWLDGFVVGFSAYVLGFGYGYVLLSHGAVGIAKRAGWVSSVRPRYRGDEGGNPPVCAPETWPTGSSACWRPPAGPSVASWPTWSSFPSATRRWMRSGKRPCASP